VGWCACGPRSRYAVAVGRSPLIGGPRAEDETVWLIACLFVRPTHHGFGVTHALVRAAVALARGEGAVAIEGWPIAATIQKSADAFLGREPLFRELGFMPGRAANAEAGYRAARPRPLNNTPLLSGSLWRSVHRPRRATPPRSAWSNIFRTTAGCWCCTDLMGAGRRAGRWLRLSKTPARQPGLWPSAAAAWAWTRGDLAPCRSRTGRQGTLDRDAGIQEASEMATPSISWT